MIGFKTLPPKLLLLYSKVVRQRGFGVYSCGEVQDDLEGGRRGLHRGRARRHHFRGGSETMMLQRPIRRGKYLEDREMIRVQVDADGSGTIDFDEFVKIMT